ncbi:Integrase H2C2 domain-containing protein, partial [Aphis craccivora]
WVEINADCVEHKLYITEQLCVENLFSKNFAHKAYREVFSNIEIQACRFHLGQCWWRKVLTLQINAVQQLLVSICPNIDIGCLFSDHILNTYVEDDCLFPPKIWAQEPSENPRTTNGSESFHKTCTKTISASKGRFNKMALAEKQRLNHTINEYKKYLIHKNIIKYLSISIFTTKWNNRSIYRLHLKYIYNPRL